MGESQSRREWVFKAAGCAAVTGLAKKNGRGKSVAGWLWLWLFISLLSFPLTSCGMRSLSRSHYWAMGGFPGRDRTAGTPRHAVGAAVVWGVPGNKMCMGGEGLRQDLEWFALHWERVNQEGCCGAEDIIDFSGRYNISSTEIEWISEPSLEEKMIAIHLGDGKGWTKKCVPLLSFLRASLIFPERDSLKVLSLWSLTS